MLASGLRPKQIAAQLGLSLSVVSRVGLSHGYRFRPGPRCKYDWPAIREFYEGGHSSRECRDAFGISCGAWDSAVARGDIVPRPQRDPAKLSHATRAQVEELHRQGHTQVEIARKLGISKSTVAFHMRGLGVSPDERFARRYDWNEVQRAYNGGLSVRQCCQRFGFCKASWTQAVARGDIDPRPRELPLDELLVNGRKRGRYNLKRRLIAAGLKIEQCERCGITEWQGRPLAMQLHHKNGDGLDNRLENLELLCANCHSQTETYGGRNGHRRRPPPVGEEAA